MSTLRGILDLLERSSFKHVTCHLEQGSLKETNFRISTEFKQKMAPQIHPGNRTANGHSVRALLAQERITDYMARELPPPRNSVAEGISFPPELIKTVAWRQSPGLQSPSCLLMWVLLWSPLSLAGVGERCIILGGYLPLKASEDSKVT